MGRRMKILVVDDHPLMRQALREVLRELSPEIEVPEAADAAAALDIAAANPDLNLILLDLGLPRLSGLEALTLIRGDHPHVPVVVFSATSEHDTVISALDNGAMGFIPKSSNSDVLLAALRLVLSGGVYLPPEVLASSATGARFASDDGDAASLLEGGFRTASDLGLTERQAQVLSLLVQGKPNKLICRELELAEGTVKIHVTAILRALGVRNRTEAVVTVGRLGLRLDGVGGRGKENGQGSNARRAQAVS